jgi:hypothetical protein
MPHEWHRSHCAGAYLLFYGLDKPSPDRGPGNVANVAPPAIPVKAPSVDSEAVVSAQLGSGLLREVLLSGVLSGFADNIPVPSAPNPKVRVPEFPLSGTQWRQTQAIAVASVDIAGTVRGFWRYGRQTMWALSGSGPSAAVPLTEDGLPPDGAGATRR